MSAVIDVRLRAEWIIGTGYRYDVLLGDEVVVRCSRDPEHDAARSLLARGLHGPFRTTGFVTCKHRMTLDIETAAGQTVVERDRGGLRVEPYRVLGSDARTALHSPPVAQGPPSGRNEAPSTGNPLPGVGGERAEASASYPTEGDLLRHRVGA